MCVGVCVKYHYGKTRNLAWPRKPRDRCSSVETVATRAVGPCRWVAGWLAGFPGRADAGLATATDRSGLSAWDPVSVFKKIAENARKRRFQFPENRGKYGNRVKKFDQSAAAAFWRLYIDEWLYCIIVIIIIIITAVRRRRRRRPYSRLARRAPRPAIAAADWYPGTIARIFSAKCDPPRPGDPHRHATPTPRTARRKRSRRRGAPVRQSQVYCWHEFYWCACVSVPIINNIYVHFAGAAVINCCRYHRRIAKQFVNRHTIQITRCFLEERRHAASDGKPTAAVDKIYDDSVLKIIVP